MLVPIVHKDVPSMLNQLVVPINVRLILYMCSNVYLVSYMPSNAHFVLYMCSNIVLYVPTNVHLAIQTCWSDLACWILIDRTINDTC